MHNPPGADSPLSPETSPVRRAARSGAALLAATALALPAGAVAVATALPTETANLSWSFDLGPGAVADGFTAVLDSNRYSAEAGYGIVVPEGATLASRNRGSTDPLTDDFVLSASWGFAVDVPAGTYDVRVWSGDKLAGTSTTKTTIALEGVTAGTISSRQAATEATFRTTVDDGQLTIGVTGEGAGGYVNGIVVTPAAPDPEPSPTPTPTPSPDPTVPSQGSLPAPQSLRTAHVAPGSATMRWNEVAGATGYVLSRGDSVTGPFTEVARTGQRDVFATDAVGTAAVRYYRVQALGADGAGAPSAVAVATLEGVAAPTLPDDGVLAFDLGSGTVAGGTTGIDATTAYSATTRYGFVDPAQVTATDRGGDDALRSDFVTVGDTELVVDLPDGDYTVSIVAGDAQGATDIAITAEQMVKVAQTARPAGQFLEMSFDVALVDGQLNLDLGGTAANLAALTVAQKSARTPGAQPTVWVTGDSTVQTYTADYVPQAGWGQMIERFLADDVTVENKAIGGRSSKNFISQGRLDEVLRQIRPGDYLFVQFGHNDNSYGVDDRYAAPADYRNYLRTYVDGAVQRGATPVLVTPVSRRSFNAETGQFNVSFPEYVQQASELAAEIGTPLVDLSASSRAYLDEIGPEAAKSVFLHVPAGVYANRPSGTVDDTHFQEYGAIQLARLVAQDVARLPVPLAQKVVAVEPPAEVPAAPAGVVAGSISSSSVQLTWTPVEGADIYKVFRKAAGAGDDTWQLTTTSTLAQAAVTGLDEGGSYDLRVVAVNGRGDSAPSATVRVTTRAAIYKFDVQPAGAPVMPGYIEASERSLYTPETGWGWLTGGMGGRDRGVGYTPPPTDLERDFLLPSPSHTFAVDVPDGTYAVKTYNGDWIGTSRSNVQIEGKDFGASNAGRGAVSEKVSQPVQVTDGQLSLVMTGSSSRLNGIEVTPLLLAPSDLVLADLTIEGAAVAVDLTWTGTDDAAGYRVYRQAEGQSAPVAVADVATPAFTDTTADVGQEYRYHVVALDPSGLESVPTDVLVVTTVDPSVPVTAAPANLVVGQVGKNLVPLTWGAVDGALFYQVYRAESAEGPFEYVGRAAEPRFDDTDVLTTVPFFYQVAAVNAGGVSARSAVVESPAPTKLVRQAERLDRSPVAVPVADGVYVAWRLLGLDPEEIGFHVYRDGTRITDEPLTGSTNLVDPGGSDTSSYRVSTVLNGIERWATVDFEPWDDQTLDVPLDKPADAYGKDGQPYSYRANDASVGDLDGDGQYEIVLKWDPTSSRDNSQGGYTGNVLVDAYELDGTRLWRIDLGRNIRAGAHYTQFQVYDLDGDGDAEVTMKTADGSVDGAGTAIGDARADYRNSSGYVLTGPEYLTVFDGGTGAALDTVDYLPARGDVGAWGDAYGNRVDRFLAGVAYLDGEHPSVIFSRGYYTRTVVAAYDFDGTDLTSRWVFDSDVAGAEHRGQGNHGFAVNDVDGDQKDEIVFGSLTLDDDGTVAYNTGLGHGDALHVSDLDPARPGLEVFAAHEDMGSSGNRGATFRDAETGEVLWSIPATVDTGRAAAGDLDARYPGAEGWAVGGDAAWNSPVGQMHAASGELIGEEIPAANFLTWWDGDLLREIGDHDYDSATGTGVPTIEKWDGPSGTATEVYRAEGTLSNNSTKGTPALQADLFGDWREELVTRTGDSTALRISTTVDVTEHRLRTLMSDPAYRLAVAWQNTGYNQPPHTSYFLGDGMETPPAPRLALTTAQTPGERVPGPATAAPGEVRVRVDDVQGGTVKLEATIKQGGDNAQTMSVLVDGTLVDTRELVDATPHEQRARFVVQGLAKGDHVIVVVAANQHGETSSKPVTVRVRSADAVQAL
ncbi:fibronectin type III domain-containing protein [Antribacter gilvus]|uniref:rhamnogalacturonan lyase family protein n=1 Tax=Antribacter gilvus TaxID=2304675 RepID=UPI001F0CAE8F|nr:fibronectin type III domain-containing protein [Antribacter gilvus]